MKINLGINTGFAVNRYPEPEVWTQIVGEELGLRNVQFTADMLNVSLPDHILKDQADRISSASAQYGISITSTFTGAFTRVNHLAHPDREVRSYWVSWFKRFVDLTVELGARSMGSHFGIFSQRDDSDPKCREERLRQNIEGWHEVGRYAKERGLDFISWEPMSITREQGETIENALRLQEEVNKNAPIDFKICLDLDHGDVSSPNPDDTDPYAWIRSVATKAPIIHLKQSSSDKSGHWPFTAKHNINGRIVPGEVLKVLKESGAKEVELLFELSFRERQPADSTVVEVLKESVAYWREDILPTI